jgi:hypothetical protein
MNITYLLIPGIVRRVMGASAGYPGYYLGIDVTDTPSLPLLVTPRWVSLLSLPLYFLRAFPSFLSLSSSSLKGIVYC